MIRKLAIITVFISLLALPILANSASNFIITKNTVTDNKTGLIWQRDSTKTIDWKSAVKYCDNFQIDKKDNWRLPELKELLTLVDKSRSKLKINTSIFNISSNHYWSSSEENNEAWLVFFESGLAGFNAKSNKLAARCVCDK